MVDVIILAGGYATRLRPLTFTKPKPLLPILNKPALDWLLDLVAPVKPRSVYVSVRYMSELIEKHINSKWTSRGLNVVVVKEDKPLGDGGPISWINRLHGLDEEFIVINGDIFTNANIAELLKAHRDNDAVATVALTQVSDVSQYGVAVVDERGLIREFVEKPEIGRAPSNLVNAGIYVFRRDALKYFPKPGEYAKIALDVLPRLIKDKLLYGYVIKGFWYDIGTVQSYIDANFRALDEYCPNSCIQGNAANVKPPAYVGEGVSIGDGAEVGPYVVIMDNVKIGPYAKVRYSVVMDGVTIERGAFVDYSVVGSDVFIGKWARVERGVVIGDGTYVGDHVLINRDCVVGPFREVNQSIYEQGKILL